MPARARIDVLRARADRAVEGMRRARIDGNGVMLELHRRDYAAAIAEVKRLLDDDGRTLHRQAGQLAAAGMAIAAAATAASWWDDVGWRRVVELLAAGACLVVAAAALALRGKIAAALDT